MSENLVRNQQCDICSPAEVVRPGGAVLPYGDPRQPNEDPSAKGLLPGRDCQQGTRGPQEDLNNDELRTSPG